MARVGLTPKAALIVVTCLFPATLLFAGVGYWAALVVGILGLVAARGAPGDRALRVAALVVAIAGSAFYAVLYAGLVSCCSGDPLEPAWPPYWKAQLLWSGLLLLGIYGWAYLWRVVRSKRHDPLA